jgi:hypothetical protein
MNKKLKDFLIGIYFRLFYYEKIREIIMLNLVFIIFINGKNIKYVMQNYNYYGRRNNTNAEKK